MKYKYYFRKPRSEIVKDVFKWLAIGGIIYIAASSPYFVLNLERAFFRWLKDKGYKDKKYTKKYIYSTFSRLRREGYITIKKRGHQIYIHLTSEGKKKANWMQIDALKIKKQKKWDKKWRLVFFDISEIKKIHREAFRGKLKDLGFYPLQRSAWIYPFDCRDEIELLRDFFKLSENELRLVVTTNIGDDSDLRRYFKLN